MYVPEGKTSQQFLFVQDEIQNFLHKASSTSVPRWPLNGPKTKSSPQHWQSQDVWFGVSNPTSLRQFPGDRAAAGLQPAKGCGAGRPLHRPTRVALSLEMSGLPWCPGPGELPLRTSKSHKCLSAWPILWPLTSSLLPALFITSPLPGLFFASLIPGSWLPPCPWLSPASPPCGYGVPTRTPGWGPPHLWGANSRQVQGKITKLVMCLNMPTKCAWSVPLLAYLLDKSWPWLPRSQTQNLRTILWPTGSSTNSRWGVPNPPPPFPLACFQLYPPYTPPPDRLQPNRTMASLCTADDL